MLTWQYYRLELLSKKLCVSRGNKWFNKYETGGEKFSRVIKLVPVYVTCKQDEIVALHKYYHPVLMMWFIIHTQTIWNFFYSTCEYLVGGIKLWLCSQVKVVVVIYDLNFQFGFSCVYFRALIWMPGIDGNMLILLVMILNLFLRIEKNTKKLTGVLTKRIFHGQTHKQFLLCCQFFAIKFTLIKVWINWNNFLKLFQWCFKSILNLKLHLSQKCIYLHIFKILKSKSNPQFFKKNF